MARPLATPDLGSLELLVAVAETGSLARAGERHLLSQPAVSMRISGLERRLGLRLLERSPTGSRLTPAGEAVVGWARPVLAAAGALVAGVESLHATATARLRVAASLTIAEYLLPSWLVGLQARLPGVSVALEVRNSTEVARLVEARQCELGFVEGVAPAPGLRARRVRTDELVVVVGPRHRWAALNGVAAAELAATPLIVREIGSGTREVTEALLAPYGGPAPPALELGSTSAVKAAVAEGVAPAVLSALTVANELATGALRVVTVRDLRLVRDLWALWRPEPLPPGPARALLDLATARAS